MSDLNLDKEKVSSEKLTRKYGQSGSLVKTTRTTEWRKISDANNLVRRSLSWNKR